MSNKYFNGKDGKVREVDQPNMSNAHYYAINEASTQVRALKTLQDAGINLPDGDYLAARNVYNDRVLEAKGYIEDYQKWLTTPESERAMRAEQLARDVEEFGLPDEWKNNQITEPIPDSARATSPSLQYHDEAHNVMDELDRLHPSAMKTLQAKQAKKVK